MKKLRLKKLVDEEYDKQYCAVSRCNELSMVIDGTKRLAEIHVPLCEEHWKIRAEFSIKTCTRNKT